jgi:tetratricopeptide (TPR) repeat protein
VPLPAATPPPPAQILGLPGQGYSRGPMTVQVQAPSPQKPALTQSELAQQAAQKVAARIATQGIQAPPATGVSFEQRRKAEKIFEQAVKDREEGRISSARMNAKLAAMYDPTNQAYKDLLDALDGQGPQSAAAPKPRALQLFEDANAAESDGDYVRAVELLEEAIAIKPQAALYNRLGVVLAMRLKRYDEALTHLRRAIELEPKSVVYMNNFSKVTGMAESFLERGGQKAEEKRNKKKGGKEDEKIKISKMRPKLF